MNYKDTIYKLQVGINGLAECPFKVTYNQSQFYSNEKHKPINMYSVKFVTRDEESGKNNYTEVYKTGVQLYMVFFMRNLWFKLNRWEIPVTQFPQFERDWELFLAEFRDELPL